MKTKSDATAEPEYEFTVDWFSKNISRWNECFDKFEFSKVLELGCYEGRSTTYIIEHLANRKAARVYCIDTWEGGIDHFGSPNMPLIEARFRKNIEIAKRKANNSVTVEVLEGHSNDMLISLLAKGHRETFDMIYVDASHQAADVLSDLVMAYQLCSPGGVVICDDYLWRSPHSDDPIFSPKLGIDCFLQAFRGRAELLYPPEWQVYIQKTIS